MEDEAKKVAVEGEDWRRHSNRTIGQIIKVC